MAETTQRLHVAHEADLNTLTEHWQAARGGDPRAVWLTAPLGGGKRALVGELIRTAVVEDEDVLVWRVPFHDEEDGMQTLLRMYAGLYQGLHRLPIFRGKVEMALNSQIPSQPKRVQGWYQAFIEGLKKGAPKPGEDQFQVIVPRDNPLVGLVEIAIGIARKFPVLMDLQNLHHSQSLAIHAMLEALIDEALEEADDDTHLLMILGTEPADETGKALISSPLLDMFERRSENIDHLEMSPWDADDVSAYLTSRELTGPAADIARIVSGRPGFVAELTDWLKEADRLGDDLSGLNLADLADITPDADELNMPDEPAPEGKRKHVGVDDAENVAFLAALLGLSFPSALLADMGGFERESIDDLLDATEAIYKELQFSKPMQTWVYQFKQALLRESVLARHTSEQDQLVAQRAASFMERYLAPQGYGYLIKTLRMYAEHGAAPRAMAIRNAALGADQAQVWAMVHDLVKYFDANDWPDPLRRAVFMHLTERMVQTGDVNQTEALWNEAMKWATDKEDRPMQGWLLFAGSRLDYRRQDLYRARDRAKDAITLYKALDDKGKTADLHGHLAMIELADGSPNAALDQVRLAEELSPIPPVQANAEFVRGLVEKRNRAFPKAIEHFSKANDIAGRAGIGALALEAGLNLGETLLISGQHEKAADVLNRVVAIARSLRNPARERAASALLGQSHAALKNFQAALQAANHTLELTRQLKFTKLEAVDLYNVGFFNLMLNSTTEAISIFKQAREKMDATEPGFQKELLFNLGMALHQIGELGQAAEALQASVEPATQTKDWRKVTAANQRLAEYAEQRGDTQEARALLQAALKGADAGGLKEDRKGIRRKLDHLGR